ncbi:MAG: hypothetical protein QXU32_11040 [Nitrososphaerales archaeon]
MAEPFIETMYAMAGVFVALVAVLFSIRGGRYARGYGKEMEEGKAA